MPFTKYFIVLSTALALLFFSILANPLPVLDEEGYLWIAENMPWDRPYDWKLPWPPYGEENAYVYAHPPMHLWAVKGLSGLGLSLDTVQWSLAIFWQSVLALSVAWLCKARSEMPWAAMVLWMSMAGVALPATRSLMPDLQMTALATLSMSVWLLRSSRRSALLAGVLLGLAAWTKYPALALLLIPFIHPQKGRNLVFCIGVFTVVGLGELWLYSIYDSIHLVEVFQRAPEIARGTWQSRLVGIANRLPISAAGLVFLTLLIPRNGKLLFFGIGASLGAYVAQQQGIEEVAVAAVLCGVGAQSLRLCLGNRVLNSWSAVVMVTVVVLHNYASPRYWMLAMAPMAIVAVHALKNRGMLTIAVLLSGVSTVCIAQSEAVHSKESQKLALEAHKAYPKARYSGEWTFRWAMREIGAEHQRNQMVQSVLWAQESAGERPSDSLYKLHGSFRGRSYPLHLVSAANSVGYYADTLGFWPIYWRDYAIEEVQLWKRK